VQPTTRVQTDGVVYTPEALARLLVAEALSDLKDAWVLDPACGAGALLAQAQVLGCSPARLCGVDIDPGALAQARDRLGEQAQLVQGDGLTLDLGEAFPEACAQGGFDAVVANPPYVRQERLGGRKDPLRGRFRAFHGAADLYVFFLERGLEALRPGGRLAVVVPNKWLRVGYGAALRQLLAREATIERLVDFGHAPLFRGSDAFPSVLVLRREPPARRAMVAVSEVPRAADGSLRARIEAHAHPVPQARWGRGPWRLEPEPLARLLDRIAERGTPLAQVLGSPVRRGVLTGFNAAFVVDRPTRDALVARDPRSAERLHPVARGRDLGRWAVTPPDHFLIDARRGFDVDRYPAIRDHLLPFRARLTPRQPGAGGPGRKPGRYRWCELQDTTAYWSVFEGPKLVHSDIAWRPAFGWSPEPLVVLNTAYVWPTRDLFLLGVVNSPVLWAWMWRRATHAKDEALRLIRSFIETLPIPDPPEPLRRDVADAVAELCAGAAGARAEVLEARVTQGVIRAFELDDEDVKLLSRTAPPRMPGALSWR